MIRRRPARRRTLVLLLLLACLLAGGILALYRAYPGLMVLRMTDGVNTLQPVVTTAIAPPPGQAVATPPESRFAVIALRPLFIPTRRPPEGPEAPATASGSAPPDLLVTGIVMAGEDSSAILEPARPGPKAKPMVARVGESVGEWTVESIEPGVVTLVRDATRHELPLIEEDDPRRDKGARRAPVPNPPRSTPIPPQRQPQPPAQQPVQKLLNTKP